MQIKEFIREALKEDTLHPYGSVPPGDHTSLATLPENRKGEAYIVAKEAGVLAGMAIAKEVFEEVDPFLQVEYLIPDGSLISIGDVVLRVKGPSRSILLAERLVLNFMQRMSGVASMTNRFVTALEGSSTKVIDTRKTTPNFRYFQKEAVKIGGGGNHRMGLYDMVMIKDNHIDFCGGIEAAIQNVEDYFQKEGFRIPVEIETRSMDDVQTVLKKGKVTRIMLDNFTPALAKEAVALIDGQFETEISGGITLETIKEYGQCGADYISVGALTHSAVSLDLSMKVKL